MKLPSDPSPSASSNTPSPAPPARVLVVDDNLHNVQVLGGHLRSEGYDLVIARNGQQGLEVAARTLPDLILLDVMMPVMDGYETCAALKADPLLAAIPVIFLTAKVETVDLVKGFQLGGVDYVTKPFNSVELLQRVRTQIELQRQRRDLAESYRALRELETLRDSLVHMLVHDLRSPLTGVLGFIEILGLRADELKPENRDLLDRALHQTQILIHQVSDILEVSRMEAGELVLAPVSCALPRLLGEARESLGPAAREVEIAPSEPCVIEGDDTLLRRVFQNLMANSVKFSPRGKAIRVAMEVTDEAVRITVADQGEGIPESERKRIFEKYGQVNARRAGRITSTGLGLTFCEMAVQAHGGTIGVESEVGVGSTFWVVLPRGKT